ncbi:leucine-rich repeat-containing protein 24-like isoform X5 [Dermacentor albipictus]|uniref:leucine-rich repeat-containing protein 24-like isoform X5 n=1 Tax=Dermacentor albipictus TaxID=60249 RepID=UPI0031FC4289
MMAVARLLRVALAVPLFFPGQARYSSAVCPSDSMIHPCSCTRVALGIRVLCSGIANEHHLRTILGYLSSYKLNALSLEHINFTLTPDLFDRLQVITVRVMESQFRMENPFELRATGGTSRIEALNVRQSTLDLGDSSLAILQGLRQVDVVNSAIRVLRRRWFNGMSRLNRLVIEHTKMGRLEDRALAGLNEVQKVVLKANELKSLRRSYFPQLAARLAHLDFSDNELTSLPSDMFQNMPVLESVTLSRNHFQTLSPEPWKPMLGQLRLVTLDGNPIDCNGTISWMLQSNARHKVSGTCAAPPNLAGTRISDLDDSRLRR